MAELLVNNFSATLSLPANVLCFLQVDSQVGDSGNAPMGMAASPGDLQQCEGCGRSFNPKAFQVHSRVCAKVFQVGSQPPLRAEIGFGLGWVDVDGVEVLGRDGRFLKGSGFANP